MDLRVVTWNLYHGRGVPDAGRDLYADFAAALAGWAWDLALLQEVPPWWPTRLAETLDCEQRAVLTSRNALPAIRRALAERWPDLRRAGGGGANAILARRDRLVADRTRLLCRRPERRRVHGVGLACGVWVSNLHASTGPSDAARRDGAAALATSVEWARAFRAPLIVGGDFNLLSVSGAGLRTVASSHVDHILCDDRVTLRDAPTTLEHGTLSDHAPLAATLVV